MDTITEAELDSIKKITGYESKSHKNIDSVCYLEVIKPLKWAGSYGTQKEVSNLIPVGSVTWVRRFDETDDSTLIEDNAYEINFDTKCFRLIKVGLYSKDAPQLEAYNPVIKYRFKTKEEFIEEGRWIHRESGGRDGGHPENWASDGGMNNYLGKTVSYGGHAAIETFKERGGMYRISFDGWSFREWNFIGVDVVAPPIEMPRVEKMPPSFRDEVPKAVITPPQPIQQVDWGIVRHKPSLSPTSKNTASIQYMEEKENLTDDIVIESTINITI